MGTVIKLVRDRRGFLIEALKSTFESGLTGFPLDDYPGATFAYSTRLLSASYAGSALRVRRSSDNAEQDIGFVGNTIDSAGLLSFVGAGDGFVVTWYDQSGNTNDATNSNASQQPRIAASGVLEELNGYATLTSPATTTRLTYPSHNPASANGEISCFTVHSVNHTNVTDTIQIAVAYFGTGTNYGAGLWGGSGPRAFTAQDTTVSTAFDYVPSVSSGIRGGDLGNDEFWLNGSQRATNPGTLSTGNVAGAIFNRTDGIWDWIGSISEIISYPTNQIANRAAIETNMNQAFNVYWDGSQQGLLDTHSSANAAYSLRALNSAYTGPLIRIRRSSDNVEINVKALYNGDLDTSAILDFVGANDAFVTTWYDQSGNGKNAIQTTAAQQPRIVASGVIDLFGSKPTIDFGAIANPNLTTSTFTLQSGETAYSIFMAADMPSDAATQHYLDYASPTFLFRWAILTNNTTRVQNNDNVPTSSLPLVALGYETNYIFSFIRTLTSAQVTASSVSGAAITGLNAPDNAGTQSLIIGTASSLPFKGKMSELILYGEDKTADRDAIKQNINEHYNVYWDGSQTGVLDTYSGAVGAYSLRALSSSYTGPLLRIRRSSDNGELDVYAKRDGTLDTDALETFCAATDGFVVTWYDQSGNGNDAEQPSAAAQPQLVTAGSVNLSNTKPSLMTGVGHQLPTTLGNTTYDIFGVTGYTKDSTTVGVMFGSTNVNDYYWAADNGGVATGLFNNVTQNALYINGAVETPVNRGDQYDLTNPQAVVYADLTISFATPGLSFGYRVASVQDFMLWQECIIYDSDQSANRGNIETLLNTYYNVF